MFTAIARLGRMDFGWGWSTQTGETTLPAASVEYQMLGQRHRRAIADAGGVDFAVCDPIRQFPAWKGKRHYDGSLWMASTGSSVPFESLTERSCLMELDRNGDVEAVSSQRMWIRWADERGLSHVPDYFVRLRHGLSVVVDVKLAKHLEDSDTILKFDRTAQICAEFGWGYAVFRGNHPVRDANLRFLRRYRDPRWDAELGQYTPPSSPMELRDAVVALGGGDLGYARCYAMLWTNKLTADFEEPLNMRTVVAPGVS